MDNKKYMIYCILAIFAILPLASSELIKVNGGKSIEFNNGSLTFGSGSSSLDVITTHTLDGNMIFTDLTTIGKFDNITKAWDVISLNGWTHNSSDIYLSPFFPRYTASTFRMYPNPNQTLNNSIMGITVSSALSVGNMPVDVHGLISNFVFNSTSLTFWSPSGFSENNSKTLCYSYSHLTSYGYDFNIGNNTALVLKEVGTPGAEFHLGASRYNVSNGSWQDWINNGWTNVSNGMLNFTQASLPFNNQSFKGTNPSIRSVSNTEEYIITYVELDGTTSYIRAAQYNDTNLSWKYFNTTGTWSLVGDHYNIASKSYSTDEDFNRRPSFFLSDSLFMFYDNGSVTNYVTYNITSKNWSLSSQVFNGTSYVVSVDPKNTIWFVYSNGTDFLSKNYTGTWSNVTALFHLTSTINYNIVGIDFINNLLTIFTREQNTLDTSNQFYRLYVYSDNSTGYWNNEVVRNESIVNITQSNLNSTYFTNPNSYGTDFFTSVTNNTLTYNTSVAKISCAHMAMDSEGYLYCPDPVQGGVDIFPPSFSPVGSNQISSAHRWGGSFDYFFFTSGVAVDNIRNKTYITDFIVNQGQGDAMPVGRIQIWDKPNRNTSIMQTFSNSSNDVVTFSGMYQPQIITQSSGNLNYPADVAVDQTNGFLYVTESLANKVSKFTLNASGYPTYNGSFGSFGSGNGQFKFPQGIDVDSSGNIYVADTNNHRIQKFNSSGSFNTSWGSLGYGSNQFIFPYDVAVDSNNNKIYVSDTYKKSIDVFYLNGTQIFSFGNWSTNQTISNFIRQFGIAITNGTLFVNAASTSSGVDFTMIEFRNVTTSNGGSSSSSSGGGGTTYQNNTLPQVNNTQSQNFCQTTIGNDIFDSFLPLPRIELGKISCNSINFWRYVFFLDSIDGNYAIVGFKIWIPEATFLVIAIIMFIRFVQSNKVLNRGIKRLSLR